VTVTKELPVGSDTGPHSPSPKSQSLSLSYGPNLPTSLTYIFPETRGVEPWRPDAVMGTSRGANKARTRRFMARHQRTGHAKTCALIPVLEPNLWTNQFLGPSTVKKKRELFPGPTSNLPRALALPHIIHVLVQEY
jgi:hypothetical protein